MRYFLPLLLLAGLFAMPGQTNAQTDNRSEDELIASLNVPDNSDESVRQFMLAVKPLAQRGTEKCVPALVAKLDNPRFAHYARFALEPNPSPKVDEALFAALETLDGDLLIGVINSIGVRKSPGALDALQILKKHDIKSKGGIKVIQAAIAAIGSLGTVESADELLDVFKELKFPPADVEIQSAVIATADAAFACAESLLKNGKTDKAIELYDAVLNFSSMPDYAKEAATFKGLLARKDGLAVAVKNLSNDNWVIFAATIKAIRELSGDNVGKTLLAELGKLDDARKAMLLEAVANRGDKVVLPELIKGVAAESTAVRLASIRGLKTVGDVTAVDTLLNAAVEGEGNSDVANAARYTMIWIPGGKVVDDKIIDVLKTGNASAKIAAMKLVEERRIQSAFPVVFEMLLDNDESVRQAAMQAIAETGGLTTLPLLFERLVKSTNATETDDLQKTLKSVAGRLPQEECATLVIDMYGKATKGTPKLFLLELLATIRGAKAIDFVENQAWVNDRDTVNKATDVLGIWPDTTAVDALLKIAKEPKHPYYVRGIRGYVRLARQFSFPENERIAMLRTTFDIATRAEDKKLIFDIFARYPSIKMLEASISYASEEGYEEQACTAAVAVGSKMIGRSPRAAEIMTQVITLTKNDDTKSQAESVRDKLAGVDEGVEIVKAVYGADNKTADVTAKVIEFSGGSSILDMPDNYNSVFGDPAPQVVKTLKITYKVKGGSEKTVEFAENAPVVLPK